MEEKIKTIIFSKHRAMQLDALLRSLSMENVFVLYKKSPSFPYDSLIRDHFATFIKEYDFKTQVIDLLKDTEYVLFLVDDEIMISPFSEDCEEFREFMNNEDILTLSLRMAKDYDYDFLKDKKVILPEFSGNKWEWRRYKHDWGYPMAATTHIFRQKDILPILLKEEFVCPNTMEHVLRNNVPDKRWAMCFDNAKFINNLANQVQDKYPQKNKGISLQHLQFLFERGDRIDLKDIKNKAKETRSAFVMVDYNYV